MTALRVLCPTCAGRGRIRSDDELDHVLRLAMNASTPGDPDAGTTAGWAWKLGEPEVRIVAALDRMVARGQATHTGPATPAVPVNAPPSPEEMAAHAGRGASPSPAEVGAFVCGVRAERARAATREAELAAEVERLRDQDLRNAQFLRG